MDERERQRTDVFQNYHAFVADLPRLLTDHAGRFALYHDRKLVKVFDTLSLALSYGDRTYGDQIFSVQKIIGEPLEIGGALYASNEEIH